MISKERWSYLLFPAGYCVLYFLSAGIVRLAFFPIGDLGVESDFYSELVVAAQHLHQGNFSVAHYPYTGPFYSFVLVATRFIFRDWYRSAIILNMLCATLSLPIVYSIARSLFDRRVAIATTISVSLVSEFYLLAHKASSDMLFFFLCYASIFFIVAGETTWKRVAASALLAALAFLTRYNGVFLPVATVGVLLFVSAYGKSLIRRLTTTRVHARMRWHTCGHAHQICVETGDRSLIAEIEKLIDKLELEEPSE